MWRTICQAGPFWARENYLTWLEPGYILLLASLIFYFVEQVSGSGNLFIFSLVSSFLGSGVCGLPAPEGLCGPGPGLRSYRWAPSGERGSQHGHGPGGHPALWTTGEKLLLLLLLRLLLLLLLLLFYYYLLLVLDCNHYFPATGNVFLFIFSVIPI